MNVLCVSRIPPYPLNNGGAQRTYAILQALAHHHTVTFSCPLPVEQRNGAEAQLDGIVSRFIWVDLATGWVRGLPSGGNRAVRLARYAADLASHLTPLAFRYADRGWQRAIADAVLSADAVVCRHAPTYMLVRAAPRRRIVVDADDLQYQIFFQSAQSGEYGIGSTLQFVEAIRSYLAEQWIGLRTARVLVASHHDRRALFTPRTTLIPNGVTFDRAAAAAPLIRGRVVFIGNCAYDQNTHGLEWFVRTVWPRIRAKFAGATLAIAGTSANLATLPFADQSDITLADDVPSMRPWLESAATSVVPLFRGAGTRIKILESLGYGTPVVSTPIGAAGLTDHFGADRGLSIAGTADEMAAAVLATLAEPERFRMRAREGQHRVQERFVWSVTTRGLAEELTAWTRPRFSRAGSAAT